MARFDRKLKSIMAKRELVAEEELEAALQLAEQVYNFLRIFSDKFLCSIPEHGYPYTARAVLNHA